MEPIAVVLLAGLTQLALAWWMRRDRLPRNSLARAAAACGDPGS